MARGYCCAFLVILSEFFLWASAVALAFMGYLLTEPNNKVTRDDGTEVERPITYLVGVSVPQVAVGLGILTLLIAIWGRLSDWRRWKCGFYIMAVSLILLFLAEVSVVCYTQYVKWNDDSTLWDNLDDIDKRNIMDKWQCCDWDPVCPNTVTSSSIFWLYTQYDQSCKDATKDDYEDWVLLVTIIFSAAAGFHLLYTCIPCLGQAKRLDLKEKKQSEKNKRTLQKALEEQERTGGRLSALFGRKGGKSDKRAEAQDQLDTAPPTRELRAESNPGSPV